MPQILVSFHRRQIKLLQQKRRRVMVVESERKNDCEINIKVINLNFIKSICPHLLLLDSHQSQRRRRKRSWEEEANEEEQKPIQKLSISSLRLIEIASVVRHMFLVSSHLFVSNLFFVRFGFSLFVPTSFRRKWFCCVVVPFACVSRCLIKQ